MIRHIAICALALLAASCSGSSGHEAAEAEIGGWPDTLRVATLYSPASYFIYRDEEMGYDYSLAKSLTQEKGLVMDLSVAPSLPAAIRWLDSGAVDMIAYEVPVTLEYKEQVLHCGPVNETSQVLVQPRGKERVKDVTELVGRDIYVEEGSKYHQRLVNLNEELGGGILIHTVDRDTLITEDLIQMVSTGEIPLTVVDSDIARINKTYYPNLDITLPIGFPQRSSWAVSPSRPWIADSINAWIGQEKPRQENAMLLKRYFELSKQSMPAVFTLDLSQGRVSPYDELFKRYAKEIGWDWRLLAAIGYIESRFDSDVRSWSGARGIMQVMPSTARAYKATDGPWTQPEGSISLATRIIADIEKSMRSRVQDPKERLKFVLAAYNSGPAHIYDAIALAKATGRNPQVWSGQVSEALLLKASPEYYNHPAVKYGYFRGRQTTTYVNEVMQVYDRIVNKIPE